ncbi:unnamed protein product [Orchesella dallaii]|uniref:Uncharacterized protein n=1 Tax=Orchesella dallaii TaxID=48710 RepID=A0ABP1S7R6_9HEXA
MREIIYKPLVCAIAKTNNNQGILSYVVNLTKMLTKALTIFISVAFSNFFVANAKIVSYTLNISYFSGFPDGTYKSKILGINNQFPGPPLTACEGDTLEIVVSNNIQDGQNTSIHWHGIHQKGSNFEDGTSKVSQCPLPSGATQIHRFKADLRGTYWYHSHHFSQYPEGLFGPLVVHAKKEAYDYDDEVTIFLSDWYHRTSAEDVAWLNSTFSNGVPPYPDSGLMNGMGRYPCKYARRQGFQCESAKQRRPVFNLEKQKTYRLRVINAAAVAAFNFSIDCYKLHTIETDGVDLKETPKVFADFASISAGQRYSFLFRCSNESQHGSRYLIRANIRRELMREFITGGQNSNMYPEALMGEVTGVIKCWDKNKGHEDSSTSEIFTYRDVVPPSKLNVNSSVYLQEIELTPLEGENTPAPDHFDQEFTVNVYFGADENGIRRGSFNNSPFVSPTFKPVLISVINGDPIPQSVFPLEVSLGNVVQLVINNPFLGPHPFHLHGHHFWVVGLGKWNDGNYTDVNGVPIRDLRLDGVKRDTVQVEERSWAVIRFVADNPGVWLFHCHIDWHNLMGMSLVFIEEKDVLREKVKINDEAIRVCRLHQNPLLF